MLRAGFRLLLFLRLMMFFVFGASLFAERMLILVKGY